MLFTDEDLFQNEDVFTFGLDCIKACMDAYGISNWENSYTTPRSPIKRCTPKISGLIKLAPQIPETRLENKLFTYYEGWFDDGARSCCDKDFKTFAEFLTSELCMEDFDKERFIHFCVMIGHMSVRLFTENAMEAPDYAYCCIAYAVMHFKNAGQFEEATWGELDTYALNIFVEKAYAGRPT